jgi:uncharacterized protein YkwD
MDIRFNLFSKKYLMVIICFGLFFCFTPFAQAKGLSEELKGKILLQVESKGEAWYVNPDNLNRYYLGRPADAFRIMRELGLGISNKDYNFFTGRAPERLKGKILLKAEDKGQAYYVNPVNSIMHYLGRPADAFRIMRELGLGISNDNLVKIRPAKLELINTIVSQQIADQTITEREEESNASDLEWKIHTLINEKRLAKGIPGLKWSNRLADIARVHSQDMVQKKYLDHKDSEGCEENCRLNKNNYYREYVIEYLGFEYNYKLRYPNGVIAEYASEEEIAEANVNKWVEYDFMFDPNLIYEGVGTAVTADGEIYITAKMVMPIVTTVQEAELKKIIANLINPQDESLNKIKKIYHWITANIDYDMDSYLTDPRPVESYTAWPVFKNRKGICEGYSRLFVLMLRYAGVEAEVISGRADAFDGWDRHAWNKIEFVGEDLYVDATWDAGFIENNKFTRNITDTYFLIPNNCILVDHVDSGEKEMTANEQKKYVTAQADLFETRCALLRDTILYK